MSRQQAPLRIGEAARATGVSVDTLRYYERLKLLPVAPRSGGGMRRYSVEVLDRVRFVKQAQSLGLSLREIQQLVGESHRRSRAGCRRVHALLARHIAEIDQRMLELQQLRRTLGEYLGTCESALGRDTEPECPTLSALEGPHS